LRSIIQRLTLARQAAGSSPRGRRRVSAVASPAKPADRGGRYLGWMTAIRPISALQAVLAAILAVSPPACQAQEWILRTDRGQNRLVIEAMQAGSLQEALEAAHALGLRQDPFVSDVISSLLGGGQQLLVLSLLHEVFPPEAGPEELAGRLEANLEGLDLLSAGLAGFTPALRREAIRLLRGSGLGKYDRQVFAVAAGLERRMEAQEGHLEAEQAELALEVLEYALSRRNPDFLDLVLRLQEASRDKPVARKAAAVGRLLLRPAAGEQPAVPRS